MLKQMFPFNMTDKQILFAIEKFPASLIGSIDIICDIYSIDYLRARRIIENKYGPIYDSLPLLK